MVFQHCTMNEMKCEKCGSELSADSKFCCVCGTVVSSDTGKEAVADRSEPSVIEEPEGSASKKRPKKSKLFLLIMAAVVLVAVIVGVTKASALENTFKRMTSSPEEYYQWVEGKQIKESIDSASSIYEDYFLALMQSYEKSISVDLSFELEESMEDWLEMLELTGLDLTWLKTGKIEWDHTTKNGITQENVGLTLDGQDLIEVSAIMDLKEERAYVNIPTLTDTYLGMELDEYIDSSDIESMTAVVDLLEKLAGALPENSKVESLLDKYTEMVLSYIDEVEVTTDKTLRAAGVMQDCTKVEVTITSQTIADMMEGIYAELAEDKEVKQIILDIVNAEAAASEDEDIDAEEVYDEFVEMCLANEEYAEEYAYYYDTIIMSVYVDGNGDIIGREIENGEVELAFLAPQEGKTVGYKYSIESYGVEYIVIEGTGELSSDKLTGEFTLEFDGYEILEFEVDKLDTVELKKGYINGGIEAKLSSKILNAVDEYYGYYYSSSEYQEISNMVSVLKNIGVSITSTMSDSKTQMTLVVTEDDEKLGTIEVVYESGKANKVSTPVAKQTIYVSDNEDLADWWDSFNWKDLFKKLDKTNIPSEIIDWIDDLSEMDGEDLFY